MLSSSTLGYLLQLLPASQQNLSHIVLHVWQALDPLHHGFTVGLECGHDLDKLLSHTIFFNISFAGPINETL